MFDAKKIMKEVTKRRSFLGSSLAELIFAMSIAGIVLIPSFFISSALFLMMLMRMRESIDAGQAASMFINRFTEEAALAQRILRPDTPTDGSAVYFSYYDPVTEKSINVGYRISGAVGSKKLERMEYNRAGTYTWTATSPYGQIPADSIILTGTPQFKFCTTPTCATAGSEDVTASAPQKATLIKLVDTTGVGGNTGLAFQKGGRLARLPETSTTTDGSDVYIGTEVSMTPVILSDEVKELYSFSNTSAFGASSVPANIVRADGQFLYPAITPSTGGVLSTLVTGPASQKMGYSSTIVTSSGRVYFGGGSNANADASDYGSANKFMWTWDPSSARLSTVMSGADSVALYDYYPALAVNGERVYFAAARGGTHWQHVFTWDPGTNVLSTVIYDGGGNEIGHNLMATSNGRVYFGEDKQPMLAHFWTWDTTTRRLSTLLSNRDGVSVGLGGHIFGEKAIFGENTSSANGGRFYVWDPTSTNLSTIAPTAMEKPGFSSSAAGGTFSFWGRLAGSGNMYCWNDATRILSTVMLSAGGDMGALGIAATSSGRVYFNAAGSNFYTWSGNVLSTLVAAATSPGLGDSVYVAGERVYFGENKAAPAKFWTWDPATRQLTTISSAMAFPGVNSTGLWGYRRTTFRNAATVDSTGRIYLSDYVNSGSAYTYDPTVNVLSTLVSARDFRSMSTVVDQSSGRVFFGANGGAGSFYTWEPVSRSLITIVPSANDPGSMSARTTSDGRVYFGSTTGPGRFWTWKASSPQVTIWRTGDTGIQTKQSWTINVTQSNNYIATVVDNDDEIYMLNTIGPKVDRYVYSIAQGTYVLSSSFTVGAWASNVTAMTIDKNHPTNFPIALLDGTGKQIYVYDNRRSSSPALMTTINLTALSTVPTTPTGLAVNSRSGRYMVIDSTSQGPVADATSAYNFNYKRLFYLNANGTLDKIYQIRTNDTANSYTSSSIDAETNLKISYDDQTNFLYVIAPTLDRTLVMTMPEYLK